MNVDDAPTRNLSQQQQAITLSSDSSIQQQSQRQHLNLNLASHPMRRRRSTENLRHELQRRVQNSLQLVSSSDVVAGSALNDNRPRYDETPGTPDRTITVRNSRGEEDVYVEEEIYEEVYSWVWDAETKSADSIVEPGESEVYFHPDYSCGTAAVKGKKLLGDGEEHYWEVKMSSAVYGTDMMIGVGTNNVCLNKFKSQFCSLIGKDNESWGISYFGTIHHDGKTRDYTKKFERGSVIGCHLDLWKGTLAFYKNGEPLGVAFEGLLGKKLYPIISSTAARTRMKLLCSYNTGFSLQYLCCKEMSKNIPYSSESISTLPLSNALKRYIGWHMEWVFKLNNPLTMKHGVGPRRKRVRRC